MTGYAPDLVAVAAAGLLLWLVQRHYQRKRDTMVRGFQQVMGAPYENPPLLPDEAAWVLELERLGFRRIKSKRSARAVRTVLCSPDGTTVAVVSSSTTVRGNRLIEVALASPLRSATACVLTTRFADPPLKLREEELVQAFPASTAEELLRHHDVTVRQLRELGFRPDPVGPDGAVDYIDADIRSDLAALQRTGPWTLRWRLLAAKRGERSALGPVLANPFMRRRVAALLELPIGELPVLAPTDPTSGAPADN